MKVFLLLALVLGGSPDAPAAAAPSSGECFGWLTTEDAFDRTVMDMMRRESAPERLQFYREVLDLRLSQLVAQRRVAAARHRDVIDIHRAEIQATINRYAPRTRSSDPDVPAKLH